MQSASAYLQALISSPQATWFAVVGALAYSVATLLRAVAEPCRLVLRDFHDKSLLQHMLDMPGDTTAQFHDYLDMVRTRDNQTAPPRQDLDGDPDGP